MSARRDPIEYPRPTQTPVISRLAMRSKARVAVLHSPVYQYPTTVPPTATARPAGMMERARRPVATETRAHRAKPEENSETEDSRASTSATASGHRRRASTMMPESIASATSTRMTRPVRSLMTGSTRDSSSMTMAHPAIPSRAASGQRQSRPSHGRGRWAAAGEGEVTPPTLGSRSRVRIGRTSLRESLPPTKGVRGVETMW